MQKSAFESTIRSIEREIDHIKLLNRLGKIPHNKAKLEIKELEIELKLKVANLPKYERHVYRIKKEFGRDF
jgi:hypothetical protein